MSIVSGKQSSMCQLPPSRVDPVHEKQGREADDEETVPIALLRCPILLRLKPSRAKTPGASHVCLRSHRKTSVPKSSMSVLHTACFHAHALVRRRAHSVFPSYRASAARAAAAPMTPMPTTGESVRTAALPLAVELALAMAELTALDAAAMSEGDEELTSVQSSLAMLESSAMARMNRQPSAQASQEASELERGGRRKL